MISIDMCLAACARFSPSDGEPSSAGSPTHPPTSDPATSPRSQPDASGHTAARRCSDGRARSDDGQQRQQGRPHRSSTCSFAGGGDLRQSQLGDLACYDQGRHGGQGDSASHQERCVQLSTLTDEVETSSSTSADELRPCPFSSVPGLSSEEDSLQRTRPLPACEDSLFDALSLKQNASC